MDEGNMFVEETLEARSELEHISNANNNILSAQSNKPEMVIVQDSLLGAYRMTIEVQNIPKHQFMKCMMHVVHDYDYSERLKQIRFLRNESSETYTTHALFGFLFPADFHVNQPNLKIVHGVVTEGYFDKTSLKGTKNSLIRILCMEYGNDVTAKFVDNVQFLTNGWLEMNPFSIGIEDCLIGDPKKKEDIENTIHKYFIEASNVAKSTDNLQIREARINCALNKSKNVNLRSAKETLKPDNNFISTVKSGSKGDDFNIAQITGLLGQQNLDGHRPKPTLTNGSRTLIHYPRVIVNDPARQYRSRGFVSSSFIKGMHPDEMFFHAMTGREGMTKTAMGTATSGYIQRSIVKINEDLKVEYDGTVRDAKKNIYQYAFGGHGFDPAKVDIDESADEARPVNVKRLAERLNKGTDPLGDFEETPQFLTLEEIEEIVEGCSWRSNIPIEVYEQVKAKQDSILRKDLNCVKLVPNKFEEFKNFTISKYHLNRATPGECVGIIGAQSIGERQTQTTLNTFHTAGKLQQSGVGRLEEILNMSKKIKVKTCVVYFKKNYQTSDELRKAVGCSIVGLSFGDLYAEPPVVNANIVTFNFDPKILFSNRLNTFKIAEAVTKELEDVTCAIGPTYLEISFQEGFSKERELSLNKIKICGMEGVTAMHLDHEHGEWFVVTEGSNLKMMLGHPLVDVKRLYCNDFWEVYETLGIVAVRKMLFTDLKNVVGGVNSLHIKLLVDKMTFRGKPCSITRYTMRNNEVGPLSKATFEESVDILISAAMRTEVENNAGVSAAVISGNQPKVGTGFMGLMIDYKKLMMQKVSETKEDDEYVPEDF